MGISSLNSLIFFKFPEIFLSLPDSFFSSWDIDMHEWGLWINGLYIRLSGFKERLFKPSWPLIDPDRRINFTKLLRIYNWWLHKPDSKWEDKLPAIFYIQRYTFMIGMQVVVIYNFAEADIQPTHLSSV